MEEMNDLISRQEALDHYCDVCEGVACIDCPFCKDIIIGGCKLCDYIDNLPSAQKTGKWVYIGIRGRFPACECSVCGNVENADWAVLSDNVNYCPNCGAKMVKEE